MSSHRFVDQVNAAPWVSAAATSAPSLSGFVVCPLAVQQWLVGRDWQWQVYQRAWQEAQALAQPSVVQRFQTELVNPN
jgi:hypothetical protein